MTFVEDAVYRQDAASAYSLFVRWAVDPRLATHVRSDKAKGPPDTQIRWSFHFVTEKLRTIFVVFLSSGEQEPHYCREAYPYPLQREFCRET
jgi:hypothetical protein